MKDNIIYRPRTDYHVCDGIGKRAYDGSYHSTGVTQGRYPTGTVRQCQCGRTWVAADPHPGWTSNMWRPEAFLARWWRETVRAKK